MMSGYAGFKAGDVINPARFVTLDDGSNTPAQSTVWQATANAKPLGIMQEGSYDAVAGSESFPAGSDSFVVHRQEGQDAYLELGDTVAIDDYLVSDADGLGLVAAAIGTTNQNVGARALQSGVSGEKILVEITKQTVRPALV